jgi:hypothetical protein
MSLQYIIDAYNIINHPCFKPRRKRTTAVQIILADFIKSNKLCGSRKNRGILVFDGYPPHGESMPEEENLVCVFSRQVEADEVIKRIVEKSTRRGNIVVVSDDKQVRSCARLLKARISTVEEFILGSKRARDEDSRLREKEESKITYSQMEAINAELKERWLK